LTIEQRLKGAALTADDLESAMTQHYRCVYGGKESNSYSKHDDGTEKEVMLVNIKGNCFKCGKPGHHANDCCLSKSGGEKGKFKRTCHNCGMTGHAATNCWEKEENKDKRPAKERCYIIAGPEFGSDNEGRPVMIVRALYGLRSSGAIWRDHMASTLRLQGFKGCLADPDIWMRPANKPDGTTYYNMS
jgi:Zinc knuckle